MKQIGPKNPINTPALTGPGRVGTGKAVVKKTTNTPAPVASKAVTTNATSGFNEQGVKGTQRPDGTATLESKSGMKLEKSENGFELKMPGTEGAFKFDGDKIEVASGEAKNPSFVEAEGGMKLLHFNDKEGNHVHVDPKSMTYEVLNPGRTVSQVYFPDGKQQVMAMGKEKRADGTTRDYTKTATFDEKGQLLEQNGFSGFELKDGKLSFDVGTGKATRTLPRAMPGKTGPAEKPAQTAQPASQNAPTALLAEQPMLMTGPQAPLMIEGPKTEAPASQAAPDPAKAAENAAKAERKQRLDALKKVDKDFFNVDAAKEGVQFAETPSGVLKRMDGDSVAFKLPTGDEFRTDGELVAVLGDKPRAKSARLVEDNGSTILAYKDQAGNNYQLDVNSGDLSVNNSKGTLRQKLYADGREEIHAESTHKTATGSAETSHHTVLLNPDGRVHRKDGFDDLKIGSKHVEYTLPNGNNTVRNLLMETKGKTPESTSRANLIQGWDEGQSVADRILGVSTTAATNEAPKAEGATAASGPMKANPFQQEPVTMSGVKRESLADGTVKTTLPSGLSFVDGEKPYAMDPDGTRLEVSKHEVPSDGGYILHAKGKNGVGYTIAPEHLDFIAESKDGKVHQMVKADNTILTSITDGNRQHVHNYDYVGQKETGSPGVDTDLWNRDKIYVMDSPQNRVYDLPHPFPIPPEVEAQLQGMGPQGGAAGPPVGGPGGPGMPQPGVKPSFWSKVKGWFGGEQPQQAQGPYGPGGPQQAHHGGPPPYMGGMPANHYQYDPVAEQMREMRSMHRGMTIANTVGMVANVAMPLLFFRAFF